MQCSCSCTCISVPFPNRVHCRKRLLNYWYSTLPSPAPPPSCSPQQGAYPSTLIGLFNQTLPGPILQFSINLQRGSPDTNLADTSSISTAWQRPQACQWRIRERLVSVFNACMPVPVLTSSPSVIFTDEQALIGEMGAIYSSASEEAASSIASYNPDEVPSQPESQV